MCALEHDCLDGDNDCLDGDSHMTNQAMSVLLSCANHNSPKLGSNERDVQVLRMRRGSPVVYPPDLQPHLPPLGVACRPAGLPLRCALVATLALAAEAAAGILASSPASPGGSVAPPFRSAVLLAPAHPPNVGDLEGVRSSIQRKLSSCRSFRSLVRDVGVITNRTRRIRLVPPTSPWYPACSRAACSPSTSHLHGEGSSPQSGCSSESGSRSSSYRRPSAVRA